MAKSRFKNGGPTRGRRKLKKMGKGWVTVRKLRGSAKPVVRETEPAAASSK